MIQCPSSTSHMSLIRHSAAPPLPCELSHPPHTLFKLRRQCPPPTGSPSAASFSSLILLSVFLNAAAINGTIEWDEATVRDRPRREQKHIYLCAAFENGPPIYIFMCPMLNGLVSQQQRYSAKQTLFTLLKALC